MRNNTFFIRQYGEASIKKISQVIENVQEIMQLESWKEAKIDTNLDLKSLQNFKEELTKALRAFDNFKQDKKDLAQEAREEKAKKAEARFLKQAEKFGYKITKKA